jgi:hypothetical protein
VVREPTAVSLGLVQATVGVGNQRVCLLLGVPFG